MKAMILKNICNLKERKNPLELADVREPVPKEKELLVKVSVCGVCHTDMDEIEGRTPPPKFPMILGHQIVGSVEKTGGDVNRLKVGDRVGIAWIHSACGECKFCLSGNENLCHQFEATGRDAPGGYAQYTTVPERYAYPIPEVFSDAEAAPLLCAGAVGYRALKLTGVENGRNLGLIGFGASAHLVIQVVKHQYPDTKVFVFVRSKEEQDFSKELGASWAGGIGDQSPEKLDYAIDTTPVWGPIVQILKNLDSGGRLVINAIRKEDADKESLLKLDYSRDLWMEKEVKSVANVTRQDVVELLQLAAQIPIKPEFQEFPLEEANKALTEIKEKKIRGAKVLKIG
jgi:propanol-preferring alcohol dehydrogenase